MTYPRRKEKEAKLVRLSEGNAKFLLDELKLQKMKRADYIPHPVRSLQRDLRLKELPRRIECFDISNIQGSDRVASMVVVRGWQARRKANTGNSKLPSVTGPR